MNKNLIVLILALIVLAYNFVFTGERVGLTDQARVLQGLSSALAYKTAIIRYWNEKKALPGKADWTSYKPQPRVDLSQTVVRSIEVGIDGPGVISVHYTARPGLESPAGIDGKTIHLIPEARDGKLIWTCLGTVDVKLLPGNCSPLTVSP